MSAMARCAQFATMELKVNILRLLSATVPVQSAVDSTLAACNAEPAMSSSMGTTMNGMAGFTANETHIVRRTHTTDHLQDPQDPQADVDLPSVHLHYPKLRPVDLLPLDIDHLHPLCHLREVFVLGHVSLQGVLGDSLSDEPPS